MVLLRWACMAGVGAAVIAAFTIPVIACLWVAVRLFGSWGAWAVLVAFVAFLWTWRSVMLRDFVPWLALRFRAYLEK